MKYQNGTAPQSLSYPHDELFPFSYSHLLSDTWWESGTVYHVIFSLVMVVVKIYLLIKFSHAISFIIN